MTSPPHGAHDQGSGEWGGAEVRPPGPTGEPAGGPSAGSVPGAEWSQGPSGPTHPAYGQPPYGQPGPSGQYGQYGQSGPAAQYGHYGQSGPAGQYGQVGGQPGQYPPYGGQPGNPYGPPPYGAGPPGQPYGGPVPKRRTGLVLALIALGVLLLAAAVLVPMSLRTMVLDRAAVQRDVAAQFEEREGVAVDLTCDEEMEVQVGATYECTGTTADDEAVMVEITITDEENAAYTWAEV